MDGFCAKKSPHECQLFYISPGNMLDISCIFIPVNVISVLCGFGGGCDLTVSLCNAEACGELKKKKKGVSPFDVSVVYYRGC